MTIRTFMCAALIFCAASAHAEELNISVDDRRPVHKAVSELAERMGFVVTYEDPQYAHPEDLFDSSAENGVSNTGHKVYWPAGGAFEVRGLEMPAQRDVDSASRMVRKILDVQDQGTVGGKFKVFKTSDILHVTPARVRDEKGNWVDQASVLDARISIPPENRSVYSMLEAICAAVSQASKARVVLVTMPFGIGPEYTSVRGADNEVARDVLMRTLASTGYKFGWNLFFVRTSTFNAYTMSLVQQQPIAKPNSELGRPDVELRKKRPLETPGMPGGNK